ncbi:uncharacterized protein C8Q71DRAFT_722156 [Rhodofomes roseus]|uniref:DUF6533 domain-containing protein n=1 Tax=Rhodofomes roseus TaxID=34475 RepID=A0ABQ8KLJ5_9APHY|nr:uncharacterized protein C8Q71DRAFT_722156 [Rhodofomes roseus]KAH9839145.1 hypothetical protein C8Q71DRAFT_722156 [Rhodofomes roseus]
MSQVTYVELVDLYEQNYQYNCAQAAIIAVLMYEYAITLRDEVSLVWRSKATSTVIFYLNRLVMIGLVVAYMLDMFTWTTDVGRRKRELVTYAEWAVLSALRVYVVNTSSWVATAATLAFALVPVAYNIVIPGLAVCDEVAKYSVSTARK